MSRRTIFDDIEEERNHQDVLWGSDFDDRNTASQWQQFINNQFTRGFSYSGDLLSNPRRALVNAAAVAVAAIEAYDRSGGLAEEHWNK